MPYAPRMCLAPVGKHKCLQLLRRWRRLRCQSQALRALAPSRPHRSCQGLVWIQTRSCRYHHGGRGHRRHSSAWPLPCLVLMLLTACRRGLEPAERGCGGGAGGVRGALRLHVPQRQGRSGERGMKHSGCLQCQEGAWPDCSMPTAAIMHGTNAVVAARRLKGRVGCALPVRGLTLVYCMACNANTGRMAQTAQLAVPESMLWRLTAY